MDEAFRCCLQHEYCDEYLQKWDSSNTQEKVQLLICEQAKIRRSEKKQITKKNIFKETQSHVERTKNSLRALTFSLINLDNCQMSKDKKILEIIKNLLKE